MIQGLYYIRIGLLVALDLQKYDFHIAILVLLIRIFFVEKSLRTVIVYEVLVSQNLLLLLFFYPQNRENGDKSVVYRYQRRIPKILGMVTKSFKQIFCRFFIALKHEIAL